MIAPFDPDSFPTKFHMGVIPVIGPTPLWCVFVFSCDVSDQFPPVAFVSSSREKCEAYLKDWNDCFTDTCWQKQEFRG